MQSDKLTRREKQVAMALAGVFSTRMLGLFMLLPVFAVNSRSLADHTGFLAGIAMGIYGLSQALLQIPFGRLSDRIGRKPVIIVGLLLFMLGSIVAATSDSIYGVIFGRAIQGAGAIASAIMALAADLTREENRTKVMAIIGMSIGASFSLAFVLGPVLVGVIGLSGIFWFTAILAGFALLIVIFQVPRPVISRFHRDTEVELSWMKKILMHPQLLRLNLGVFLLHFIMTAMMFSLPLILVSEHHFELHRHWLVYLPVMLLSVVIALPFIIIAEKQRKMKEIFVGSILVLVMVSLGIWEGNSQFWLLILLLWIFFGAFNFLEASLPSLIAKFAPPAHKGTAMGAFSSSQFLGAFVGGVLAGWLSESAGPEMVFLVCAIVLLAWLVVAVTMSQPPYLSSRLLQVGDIDAQQAQHLANELSNVPGVAEAVVIPGDSIAYLKVDSKELDEERLYAFSTQPE
jgi:MFS family permease